MLVGKVPPQINQEFNLLELLPVLSPRVSNLYGDYTLVLALVRDFDGLKC